ncbi:MAG: Arm DNA-binding domain-containing protein [Candidatus Pseudobacter hemicellulosilyticus]|uniref:Arm DNA-binding domain-containing protein n=1 Tax=Candidatus Pseudobacter hemicellulosilyticus TaxID=3121375 RepID=A0AAJ6BGP0_9BACT|nr:MAG: Arm DNA-binding domain-containing protein [Pseudobacter sp.]
MASVKVVLRKEQKADGTYPLAIRVIKNRKPSYIYLDYRIDLGDWDEEKQWIKKSCPNYKRLDNFLLKKLSEAKDHALEVETKIPAATSRTIRQKIKPQAEAGFFAQAQDYLDQLKQAALLL